MSVYHVKQYLTCWQEVCCGPPLGNFCVLPLPLCCFRLLFIDLCLISRVLSSNLALNTSHNVDVNQSSPKSNDHSLLSLSQDHNSGQHCLSPGSLSAPSGQSCFWVISSYIMKVLHFSMVFVLIRQLEIHFLPMKNVFRRFEEKINQWKFY